MPSLDWSQCPAVESVPGKVSGAWVFRDTRLPVATVIENLEDLSVEEVMEQFDVTPQEAMEDFMMVGLRLLEGVRSQDFMDQFGETIESHFGTTLQGWINKKLIEQTPEGYRLSKHGILLGNEVFASFLT